MKEIEEVDRGEEKEGRDRGGEIRCERIGRIGG
jgi:hypothetical protein